MSESILNALIHLFAIVGFVNPRGVSPKARKIVKSYLNRYLNPGLIDEYVKLFDNYVGFYKRELSDYEKISSYKDESLISFQIKNICKQIKKGLLHYERMIVFLQLLEYIFEDTKITKEEKEFIEIVADVFHVSGTEYQDSTAFMLDGDFNEIDPGNLLVIDNHLTEWSENLSWFMKKTGKKQSAPKHIYIKNMYGQLHILRIPSINAYIFKYRGELNLYFGGRKVVPGRPYLLEKGTNIIGPNTRTIYYSEIAHVFLHEALKTPIVFNGAQIEFHFKNSTNGIQEFNFSEESGTLVGIMGGSGVGKSTLLNILNGKIKPKKGEITINGYNIHRYRMKLKGLIGYVPQDDLLIEELTVYQNLYFNAKFCFNNLTEGEIKKTVNGLLLDLDLYEIKDLKVGNPLNKFISGGQRKRLNIGLELMREPAILFIDEPTSGLSSSDSEKVMNLLKNQSEKGKLVFANIHQPSSDIFKLFDKLWILDKGGYPVYNGNPVDALVYFKTVSSKVNAAESECPRCGNIDSQEILQIIEAKKIDNFGHEAQERQTTPKEWYNIYREKIEPTIPKHKPPEGIPENKLNIPPQAKQLRIFFRRNLFRKLADKQYLIINLLEAPFLAFILGYFSKFTTGDLYVFAENKNLPVFLFMAIVVSLFMGLTVSAEEIIRDRSVLERESFLNLSWFSYLNSKLSFLFLLSAFQAFSFVLVAHAILRIHDMLLVHWLILFSTSCFANLVGLNISSGLKSVISIYILIPLIIVPQLLLGGAMIKFDDLHKSLTNKIYVPLIGDIMTSRWAYEALIVNQFKNNSFEKHFFEYEMEMSQHTYHTSFLIPRLDQKLSEAALLSGEKNDAHYLSLLQLLRKEIKKLHSPTNSPYYQDESYLDPEIFNPTIADEIKEHLKYLQFQFNTRVKILSAKKDSVYQELVNKSGKDGVYNLRKSHYNNKLASIALSRDEIDKIIEVDNQTVQKYEPIFMYPTSNLGRAHFYAPYKLVAGGYVDTVTFNIFAIWLGSTILYFTLFFEVLKKALDFFENIRLRRLLRKLG